MAKRIRQRKLKIILLNLLVVAGCLLIVFILFGDSAEAPDNSVQNSSSGNSQNSANAQNTKRTNFDKTKYSTSQPGSIWWIVNKSRPLPAGYVPEDLVVPSVDLRLPSTNQQMLVSQKIVPELEAMFAAAKASGNPLIFASGYRSEAYQRQLYNGYVARDGQAAADRYSARPGTSEHQTGLSFDICQAGTACDLTEAFADTTAGKWVAANAHNYGFIIHYLPGKEAITGYNYEPWHLRYVGKELATELFKNGQAIEEFLL